MSETLDDAIRALAQAGTLTYISLAPSKNGWKAVFAPANKFGSVIGEHKDPVQAVHLAFAAARKRAPAKMPTPKPNENQESTNANEAEADENEFG